MLLAFLGKYCNCSFSRKDWKSEGSGLVEGFFPTINVIFIWEKSWFFQLKFLFYYSIRSNFLNLLGNIFQKTLIVLLFRLSSFSIWGNGPEECNAFLKLCLYFNVSYFTFECLLIPIKEKYRTISFTYLLIKNNQGLVYLFALALVSYTILGYFIEQHFIFVTKHPVLEQNSQLKYDAIIFVRKTRNYSKNGGHITNAKCT